MGISERFLEVKIKSGRQYGSVGKGLAMQAGNPCSIAETHMNMDGINWLPSNDVAYSPSTGDTEAGSFPSLV